jgi:carbamoyltransferase
VGSVSDDKIAVLGVSAHYHDAAAALVIDGDIVAAAQEERFTRIKGDAAVPERSVDYVMRAAGIGPGQLRAVVFYESPFAKFDRILSTQLAGNFSALPRFVASMSTWLPRKLWVAHQLGELVGDSVPVCYSDHHLSHAAAAFFPSPFEDAAVVTVDGVGEWTTTSVGRGTGGRVELIEHLEYPNSLGLLYSAFTAYCGFKVNSGEYKLMGLAPYGQPRFVDKITEELIHLSDDGSYAMNPAYFAYFNRRRSYTKAFENLFGAPGRRHDEEILQRHADVAASIQVVTDRAMLGLCRRARDLTGSSNLCLSGGVALNVVSVGMIERAGIFDQVWVQPAAGDAGSALGAALWASHHLFDAPRRVTDDTAMRGCFLGPGPSDIDDPSAAVLGDYSLVAEQLEPDALADAVAAHIADGKVVAVARGRMEFGPRALGARSILADARDPQMQRRLNLATKFREGFRPFAPVVLAERGDTYFELGGRTSPYMLKTYYVRDEHRCDSSSGAADQPGGPADGDFDVHRQAQQVRSTVPAVTHVDYSARVQTVSADNEFLHAVLEAFDARTGCPVLVNTSFNVRGEPIVASARDAVECFLHADIDVLVLDDFLVVKQGQTPESLVPRRSSARGAD